MDDHDHLARVWITSRSCSGGSEARSLLHVVTDRAHQLGMSAGIIETEAVDRRLMMLEHG